MVAATRTVRRAGWRQLRALLSRRGVGGRGRLHARNPVPQGYAGQRLDIDRLHPLSRTSHPRWRMQICPLEPRQGRPHTQISARQASASMFSRKPRTADRYAAAAVHETSPPLLAGLWQGEARVLVLNPRPRGGPWQVAHATDVGQLGNIDACVGKLRCVGHAMACRGALCVDFAGACRCVVQTTFETRMAMQRELDDLRGQMKASVSHMPLI